MNDPLTILRLTSYWANELDLIKIDHDAIARFAQTVSPADIPTDPGVRFFHDGWTTEEKVGLLLIFNSINFSFWPNHGQDRWVVQDQNDKALDGSTAAFWCLENAAKEGTISPLDFRVLERISGPKLAHILHHCEGNEIPMLKERTYCLNELGASVYTRKGRDMHIILEMWDRNAVKAIQYLTAVLPNFRDIPFLKRAQLAVSMIHRVMLKEQPDSAFENIGVLTAFADYRLPQVLRGMGVLIYRHDFAQLIDREANIARASLGEMCIRASTVWAAEYLRQELEKQWETPVTAAQVDTFLWYKARELKDSLKPHHRTRTIAY